MLYQIILIYTHHHLLLHHDHPRHHHYHCGRRWSSNTRATIPGLETGPRNICICCLKQATNYCSSQRRTSKFDDSKADAVHFFTATDCVLLKSVCNTIFWQSLLIHLIHRELQRSNHAHNKNG